MTHTDSSRRAMSGGAGTRLAMRALLALILMVAFYLLAAAAVVGLGWAGIKVFSIIPDIRVGKGIIAIVLAGGGLLGAACVIAWSILPRVDRFEPPGPELFAADAPDLFAALRQVATATAQTMPKHVYLVPEVNAFVTERGGIMGVGSQRVMGIGLPLLQLLSVSELKAVIAHEFGHFCGGDTKLGPWIYKTRGAVGRTIMNLHNTSESVGEASDILGIVFAIARYPFEIFGRGFMSITQAISRNQEYQADALAARLVGSRVQISALEKVCAGALGYHVYFRSEVEPLIGDGYLPPLLEGYRETLRGGIGELLDEYLVHERENPEQDRYDSHPPLALRTEAVTALAIPDKSPDDRPAIDLIADVRALELRLSNILAEGAMQVALKPIEWHEATSKVYIPSWRRQAQRSFSILRNANANPLEIKQGYAAITRSTGTALGELSHYLSDEQFQNIVDGTIENALVNLLLDAGYQPITGPGQPVRFRREELEVDIHRELQAHLDGEIDEQCWQNRLAELGIANAEFEPLDLAA